jgi:hypothetical protein
MALEVGRQRVTGRSVIAHQQQAHRTIPVWSLTHG